MQQKQPPTLPDAHIGTIRPPNARAAVFYLHVAQDKRVMRTERNKDGSWKVWMNREEYRHLPRYAPSTKAELAIRLMGDCGLRVAETLSVSYDDTDRSQDGKHYFLAVTEGKDTTGEFEGGKYRETWLTPDLERDLYRYYDERDLDQSEPLIDREKRTVQWWVEQAAERAAEETGDDDYRKVSTHDLRRCWANYLLVEESTSPRIVMALGGWNSYDAIEPYLAAPTESNIVEQMSNIAL